MAFKNLEGAPAHRAHTTKRLWNRSSPKYLMAVASGGMGLRGIPRFLKVILKFLLLTIGVPRFLATYY